MHHTMDMNKGNCRQRWICPSDSPCTPKEAKVERSEIVLGILQK